jgi:hypothetical protein
MEVATLLRKVKRQFGDEYNLLVNDQDIYDYANEAQLNVVRETSSNDRDLVIPANLLPYRIPGRVLIKRVSVNNRSLLELSLEELDINRQDIAQSGTSNYYYVEQGTINLWPQPASSDTYDVTITYASVPDKLELVAPYFFFNRVKGGTQYASIAHDANYHTNYVHVYIDVTIVDVDSSPCIVVAKGTSISVAANLEFYVAYESGPAFTLATSNGTTITAKLMNVLGSIVNGDRLRLSLLHNTANGNFELYRYVEVSDGTFTPVLQDTETSAATVNTQTLAQPITMGSIAAGVIPPANKIPSIFLHEFYLSPSRYGSPLVYGLDGHPLVHFKGTDDLSALVDPTVTPVTITTGQTASIFGGIVGFKDNELSVPEVYHEDIARFCLARAHEKNQNYRASEGVMKDYEQKVANRREEANSTDGPEYKLADPEDYSYGGYWDY